MTFTANNDIISGLPDVGANARPAIFWYQNELYLFDPQNVAAFKYNSTILSWEVTSKFKNTNSSYGVSPKPTIFYFNGVLHLICGIYGGTFTGFKWSEINNQWETNSDIISGLGDIGSWSAPTYFEYNSEKYLISGRSTSSIVGFKWNATILQWENNTAIINGITTLSSYTRPVVFFFKSSLYFFERNNCYKWNDIDTWELSTICENVTSYTYQVPAVFLLNDDVYLIYGETTGNFYGFILYSPPPKKIYSVLPGADENYNTQIIITLTEPLTDSETIIGRYSNTLIGLDEEINNIELNTSDNITFSGLVNIIEGQTYFFRAIQQLNNQTVDSLDSTGNFYILPQIETTVINIVPPNYKTLDNPRISNVHGLIYNDGFVYGSARGKLSDGSYGASVFKIKKDDYSQYSNITFYYNKITSSGVQTNMDQIVFLNGFLWTLANGGALIRINPADLDYMIFQPISEISNNQPIGTDGINLYITTDIAVYKINVSVLISDFAAYGYNGTQSVIFPVAAIISSCDIIQKHPTIRADSHSIQIDENFIYLAVTTSFAGNGYDADLDIYIYHFQKIDKITMTTVGDVTIPRTTDDMVQNSDYVFLAPEMATESPNTFGSNFGLIAIKKSNLELKYLKALHADFNTENEYDRAAYGIQYFNNYLIVQLIASRKSIVINTSNVESWGPDFPIGGATTAIYKFQKDGVDIVLAPNELVLDSDNYAHITTWGLNGDIMKFFITEIGIPIPVFNAVSLLNTNTVALLQLLNTHFGCSVRCVQDAPGVATGVTGTVTDQDGNTYDTVVINEKRWMVQNLKTKKYRNGDAIPEVAADAAWQGLSSGGYCNVI